MLHAVRRAASIAALVALAASSTWTARADAPGATIGMSDEFKFEPSRVTIKVGQSILWTNRSTMVHTVTADPARAIDPTHVKLPPGAAPFDSGRIRPGAQFSHVFTTAGQYAYVCLPHERKGMIGFVTVEP